MEYLDPRNRSLNKSLLAFHRTHDFRSNGTLEMPFGPDRKFLNSAPGFVSRIVERWQLGGIFSWSSGAPITITASECRTDLDAGAGDRQHCAYAQHAQHSRRLPEERRKDYLHCNGRILLRWIHPGDRSGLNSITALQTLSSSFGNKALADANGNIILANPAPGVVGTLGRQWIEGRPTRIST